MSAGVILRSDWDAQRVEAAAVACKDAKQFRRLKAIAAVFRGMSRAAAAKAGDMDRQTLRDWVHRFNSDGPEGLFDRRAPGKPAKLTKAQKAELALIVERGPDAGKDGIVRWRCCDLATIIEQRFAVVVSDVTVGRMLKEQGFTHVSARPRHPGQDAEAIEAFKKNFSERVSEAIDEVDRAKPVEIWFQDEMRVGQKNGTIRQWNRKGIRPRQPQDQRYLSAYLFGAICPALDKGTALILPVANTEAMQLHLDEIAKTVTPGAHALLIIDQAGWHMTDKLAWPANISPLPLPPRSPELNPVENIWQFLRQTYLSNRVFETYDDILDACSAAWNALVNEAGRIRRIGVRRWASVGQGQ
jgi:transposase